MGAFAAALGGPQPQRGQNRHAYGAIRRMRGGGAIIYINIISYINMTNYRDYTNVSDKVVENYRLARQFQTMKHIFILI